MFSVVTHIKLFSASMTDIQNAPKKSNSRNSGKIYNQGKYNFSLGYPVHRLNNQYMVTARIKYVFGRYKHVGVKDKISGGARVYNILTNRINVVFTSHCRLR